MGPPKADVTQSWVPVAALNAYSLWLAAPI